MPSQVEFDDDPNRPESSPPDEEDEFEEDDPPPRRCARGDMISEKAGVWGVAGVIRRSLAQESTLENTGDDGHLNAARRAVFILFRDHG
jgi:hypothetical protein